MGGGKKPTSRRHAYVHQIRVIRVPYTIFDDDQQQKKTKYIYCLGFFFLFFNAIYFYRIFDNYNYRHNGERPPTINKTNKQNK